LGILLGAGIGTTLTSQMVAFDVTKYSLWLVTIGFAMRTFSSQQMMEYYGIKKTYKKKEAMVVSGNN